MSLESSTRSNDGVTTISHDPAVHVQRRRQLRWIRRFQLVSCVLPDLPAITLVMGKLLEQVADRQNEGRQKEILCHCLPLDVFVD
ncbi:hypothetical protein CDAR_521591 [Caerostris darwini]|uniref:Uncharacterized protein n=1 Tax=Caerostris darwini TaxID=1538125 RepID=A0AAV4TM70_9ARAC|nr:hypothetical protein CDAR_521591 [Caerostris darwini]